MAAAAATREHETPPRALNRMTLRALPSPDTAAKYRHAAWGFFALNLLYMGLVYLFLPPFNLGFWAGIGYTLLALTLFGSLSWFIYRGGRRLVLVLMALYSARALLSVYTLVTEQAFVAVPYVLPVFLVTIYLLGRPLWNWP